MKLGRFLMLISALGCGASCMTNKQFSGKVFQRIAVGSDGAKIVVQPVVHYGRLTIPDGTNMPEILPIHGIQTAVSQEMEIPGDATVEWISEGTRHSVVVPVRELASSASNFYGFEFRFTDDHLDVYILNQVKSSNSPYLNIVRSKVFSE